jgi:nitroreductase
MTNGGGAPSTPETTALGSLIRRRRMTRSFTDRPIDRQLLAGLLDLARRAPSAGYSQGVHLLALTGQATQVFWDVTGCGAWFEHEHPGLLRAPVVVLPLADAEAYTSRYAEPDKAGAGLADASNWPVPYWLTDTAMATQQLLLLAEEAGLGALFFGIFANEPVVLEQLGVPAGIRAIGAIALGYRDPDDQPSGSPQSRPRRQLASVIHYDRW